MAVDTSAGLTAWLADHPGATAVDFEAQRSAETSFALQSSLRANPAFLSGGSQNPPPFDEPVGSGGGGTGGPSMGGWPFPPTFPPSGPPSSGGNPIEPGPPPSGPTGGAGEDEIINIVNNFLAQNNIDTTPIGRAIQQSLRGIIQSIDQTQQNTVNLVTSGIEKTSQNLLDYSQQVQQFVTQNILAQINGLFAPSGGITAEIDRTISSLGSVFDKTVAGILTPLSADLEKVANSLFGLPVDLGAIFKQLWGQLPGILFKIAIAEGGPLKDIAHWVEILTGHLPGGANSKVKWDDFGVLLGQLSKAGADIAGAATSPSNVIYKPWDKLEGGCSAADMAAKLDEWLGKNVGIPCWLQDGLDGVRLFIAELSRILPWIEQAFKIGEEEQNKACALQKLPADTMIQAFYRGMVDQPTLFEELGTQGISQQRVKLLGDLYNHFYTAAEALDLWWRSIIDEPSLRSLLAQNGYNPEQQDAAIKGSFRLTDAATATLALNRGVISDDQFGTILTALHFDSTQIDLFRALRLRPATPNEVLKGELTRRALGNFAIPRLTDFDTIPTWFSDAGAADGIRPDAIQRLWWSHFNLGGWSDWLSAYYRNLRTLPELLAVAQGFGIPESVASDLIDTGRPLIPFRTIPPMVTAGILPVDEARKILGHHGFASHDIDLILAYAGKRTTAAKATAAQTQHNISTQSARNAYDDGILNREQYIAILEAHGLDAAAAELEVQLADIALETKNRKQVAADIVAEYQAGLIDQTTAAQNLASSGLSMAEQARALKQLQRANVVKVKLPGEGDLHNMAKAGVISPDDYYSTLIQIGYTADWAQHFKDWRFPSAPETAAAP